jgi:predicted RNA binding protein YcfA (HicA-like mRNA interferase family)
MPPVPSVRGERVVRALERAGFKIARVAGSHHIMRHPDGRGTTVPVHQGRDVAKGTLRGIMSDVGMRSRNCGGCCDHVDGYSTEVPQPVRTQEYPKGCAETLACKDRRR